MVFQNCLYSLIFHNRNSKTLHWETQKSTKNFIISIKQKSSTLYQKRSCMPHINTLCLPYNKRSGDRPKNRNIFSQNSRRRWSGQRNNITRKSSSTLSSSSTQGSPCLRNNPFTNIFISSPRTPLHIDKQSVIIIISRRSIIIKTIVLIQHPRR